VWQTPDWDALDKIAALTGTRGPVTEDFVPQSERGNFVKNDLSDTAANAWEKDAVSALIGWLSGKDQRNSETTADANGNGRLDLQLRSRQFDGDKEWRLGDVIHSTPMTVSKPAENYHDIYRDRWYGVFYAKYLKRRTMIYFGGNDGMLHAVNGGFYNEAKNQFCCTDEFDSDGTCKVKSTNGSCDTEPALGQELWAYIPYNLQPHLKCLTKTGYSNSKHKYYVDQKPRIFDAQIFTPESACGSEINPTPTANGCIHPGGWGTILVGALGLGGAPIMASDLHPPSIADNRKFISSFFILDITNPNQGEPTLLGEMTQQLDKDGNDVYATINHSTSSPAMIIMRDGTPPTSQWYLVMGNGPAALDGTNKPLSSTNCNSTITSGCTKGTLAVLSLNDMQSKGGLFRIPTGIPQSTGTSSKLAESGIFSVPLPVDGATPPNVLPFGGYLSDIISVDYNFDDTSSATDKLGVRYKTDAVYFGTVDGNDFANYDPNYPKYLEGLSGQTYWNGGGRIFRLVTKKLNLSSPKKEVLSKPSVWPGEWIDANPLRMLADVKMPVTAAPSVGFDGFNYWIYAGTGRFYDPKDKTDDGWCWKSSSSDPECSYRSKSGFFGLKEPFKDAHPNSQFVISGKGWANPPSSSSVKCTDSVMTWGMIDWDINTQSNQYTAPSLEAGKRGLMQTDRIFVSAEAPHVLACLDSANQINMCYVKSPGSNPCDTSICYLNQLEESSKEVSPVEVYKFHTFDGLKKYIAGTGCTTDRADGVSTGLDGWYRHFRNPRQRNLGTSALLGGLLTYTTYQPYNDPCQAEGMSYLYGVHYQTGTAWTDTVFGNFDTLDKNGHQEKNTVTKKIEESLTVTNATGAGIDTGTGTVTANVTGTVTAGDPKVKGGTFTVTITGYAKAGQVTGTFTGTFTKDGITMTFKGTFTGTLTGTTLTGTLIGTVEIRITSSANPEMVMDEMSLGTGLSTTPSMHVGTGEQAAKAFIQTSTGEIIEINQENLPIDNTRSGRVRWYQYQSTN
ncbi:hypothetical protein VU07_02135, partial [Desulfobulbus sp. F4]|nr:hypothetical protein [Desulfobulbus sp. F4]